MKIIRNIIAILRGVLIILTMLGYLLGYAFTRIFSKHTKSSGLALRRAWIRQMAYPILNLNVKVEGEAIETPALYVCNHRSFVDPIIISKYVDAFIIAKAEIANYPVINKGAEVTGIIWVKREEKASRTDARRAFIDVIKQGHNILVYPEGTVSTQRTPLPFKQGTFHEAAKQHITVVPVALEFRDDKDLWQIPNIVGQYLNGFGHWTTEAKLAFGPPITSVDGEEVAQHCESWINNKVVKTQEGWSRMNF